VNDNGCKGASVWLLRHTSTWTSIYVKDLRSSQRWLWRVLSSEI
jgi:hypothetical protein